MDFLLHPDKRENIAALEELDVTRGRNLQLPSLPSVITGHSFPLISNIPVKSEN